MRRQARLIASWGENVYVKIPVTTTAGEPMTELVRDLSHDGVKVNVTAMLHARTGRGGPPPRWPAARPPTSRSSPGGSPTPVSIPCRSCARAVEIMAAAPAAECIWASPREVLNLVQANSAGCHIITMTPDLLRKLDCLGKDLSQFSLETVQMFFRDAAAAGYSL